MSRLSAAASVVMTSTSPCSERNFVAKKRPKTKPAKKKPIIPSKRKHLLLLEVEADADVKTSTVRRAVDLLLAFGKLMAEEVKDDTGGEEGERLLAAYADDLDVEIQPVDYRLNQVARQILSSFRDNSAYEDYQQHEGFTDEEFEAAVNMLEWLETPPGDPAEEITFHICQNCQQVWAETDLKEIRRLHERVAPGEPMPSGECPTEDCGAVCHPMVLDPELEN